MSELRLFQQLNKADFLKDYWQKKAYCFRNALNDAEDIISGDELAYLSCDEQIESRFVFCDENEFSWNMEAGPFKEERFNSLPNSPYTLMVQSVDQWVPEIHHLRNLFDFIPSWRLDDVLATYATEGGGVGPHFDYYDVFLIQTSGQRRWRIGQMCDENTELRKNSDLKLLKHFAQTKEFILSPGDILYVPPGLAHWGTGLSDDCVTLSIGFRAPSQAELLDELIDPLIQSCSEDSRFTDTLDSLNAQPGEINRAAIKQAVNLLKSIPEQELLKYVEDALGNYVSRPRNLDIIQAEDGIDHERTLEAYRDANTTIMIELDAACRAAYIAQNDESATLYLNGKPNAVSLEFAKGFCEGEISNNCLRDEHYFNMLLALAKCGLIYLEDTE